jgi:hypothetical protein
MQKGADGVAQVTEHKCKALSSAPQYCQKKKKNWLKTQYDWGY